MPRDDFTRDGLSELVLIQREVDDMTLCVIREAPLG
jgi:hypothetical protein